MSERQSDRRVRRREIPAGVERPARTVLTAREIERRLARGAAREHGAPPRKGAVKGEETVVGIGRAREIPPRMTAQIEILRPTRVNRLS